MWSHVLVSFIKVIKLTQADRIANIYERGSSEFHLIKIVIFHLIESFIFTWSNFLRLFTWSKLSIMRSIKRLKSCHLIKSFINDSIKWKNPSVLFGTWSKVLIMEFWAFKTFDQVKKIRPFFFWHLNQKFL